MAPSQSVVVVGKVAVWVVPNKPGIVGHLLMETNETEMRMRNKRRRERVQINNKLGKCKIKKLAFILGQ